MHGDLYHGVFTTSGKLHLTYQDGHLPGDIPLRIVRTYDTASIDEFGFSTGWSINYFKRIEKDARTGKMILRNSTGTALSFGASRRLGGRGTARYLPPTDEATGINCIIEDTGTNVLTLEYIDGSRILFATKGTVYRPTKILGADQDNYVDFTYNGANQLTKVENNSGCPRHTEDSFESSCSKTARTRGELA